ncbi:MAG: bifunctional [glutamate--ammonia ligase]-adenylyl-L-tyrosine phosphorylase/[glutamate--ammonia-ligase] adenylyltransferase [Methylophilaceae bacterium]
MKTLLETAKELKLMPLQVSYLQRLEACSPFMARQLAKDAVLLADLLKNHHISYRQTEMQQFLSTIKIVDENALKKSLRMLRQSVLARIILRDLNDLADLQEVMLTTTQLAEMTIQTAIEYHQSWLEASYGKPLSANGKPQNLIVVGMGKLGGSELNVSSDVDLIFAYEQEGQTNGANAISNQDFFTRLGKKVIAALDEVTEDGFVFRVDMRLRPFGGEGALVSNLDALEEYYQNNGREWERYAWIKGRVVAGAQDAVTELLKPFIFRKYLDYGAFASMRDLKVQIQREVVKKSAVDNIKLGRGGIREIEFIAQVFQLIRGGQDASLQIKPTLSVLKLLQSKSLLSEKTCSELMLAYSFLRNLEHRLMYVEDQQTQDLPKTEVAQNRIAKAMNFASWQDFLQALNLHRETVQTHFDATFNEVKSENQTQSETFKSANAIWNGELDEAAAVSLLAEIGFSDAENTFNRLQQLHQSHRYKQLPELSRQRFNALLPMVIEVASQLEQADSALMRSMDLIEAVCRRASYLALLAEYPKALSLVVKLCGASVWCAQYLTKHPIVLDELLDERTLYAVPDFVAMRDTLAQSIKALAGDTERQMDAMRQFKHAAVFRFAAQDIAGELKLETLSDYLSALADLILDVALNTIWKSLKFKHIEQAKFAVIGYGKLGGKELGYASDLDIIFLYDDDSDSAGEVYGRFAQRINNWFNSLTAAGLLYETDLQLRPDGNSGLLVSSVDAFRDYQQNRAWIWEHQALTRARFVAGDVSIGEAFEAVRINVLRQARDAEKLRVEVAEMREKMQAANLNRSDLFDLKIDKGGIIDVEFIVQFLVLAHAAKYAELTNNIGNIALLKTLGLLGLIDTNLAKQVADAYREYRRLQHAARLQGNMQARVEITLVQYHADAVKRLWQAVFT